jgi:hypothetical protein
LCDRSLHDNGPSDSGVPHSGFLAIFGLEYRDNLAVGVMAVTELWPKLG